VIIHEKPIVTDGLVGYFDAANLKSYDSRENYATYSSFNAPEWGNVFTSAATMTTGITAPDGTTSAVRFACNTSGQSLLRVTFPNVAPNGTDTYTCSFYARLISGTTGGLAAGFADTNPTIANYVSQLVANEWVRIVISGVPAAGTRTWFDLVDNGTRDYVVDLWGLQVERGSVATAYTPTSGTRILRTTSVRSNSSTYRTNLVTNPSFEVGTTSWEGSFGGTISRITTDAFTGTSCLQVVRSATEFSGTRIAGGSRVPIGVGRTYTASAYVKVPSGQPTQNLTLYAQQFDALDAGNLISQTNTVVSVASTAGWTRLSRTFVGSAGATHANVTVRIDAVGTASTFLVDSVLIEESPSSGTYFDGSTGQEAWWTGTPHASASRLRGPSAELRDTNKYSPTDYGSFVFDGTNDFATTNIIPSTTSGTFSVWFRVNAHKNFNTLFDNGTSADDWECWLTSAGLPAFRTAAANGDIRLDGASALATNQWHNITVTYGPSSGIMYVNGVSVSVDNTVGTRPAPGVIHLGGANNTRLNGNISSFMYYERALTATEVLQNYNAMKARYGL
jgi:hypothetical protein